MERRDNFRRQTDTKARLQAVLKCVCTSTGALKSVQPSSGCVVHVRPDDQYRQCTGVTLLPRSVIVSPAGETEGALSRLTPTFFLFKPTPYIFLIADMVATAMDNVVADIRRYLMYIQQDVRGHQLASVRGAALFGRLQRLVEASLQRIRQRQMQPGLLVPIQA